MRLARLVSVSSSFAPVLTSNISCCMDTDGLRSSGRVSDFRDLVTPTASIITKWSLFSVADGVTCCNSSLDSVRVPRPFICSKNPFDLTSRIKTSTSIDLTSVPVAIIFTVMAILGL